MDLESLNKIRKNAQAAARLLFKRSEADHKFRLWDKCAAMPVDELEKFVVTEDGQSKLVAAILKDRLHEELQNLTTPKLQDISSRDGSSIRCTVTKEVLLGRNNTPAPVGRTDDECILDEADLPRWI